MTRWGISGLFIQDLPSVASKKWLILTEHKMWKAALTFVGGQPSRHSVRHYQKKNGHHCPMLSPLSCCCPSSHRRLNSSSTGVQPRKDGLGTPPFLRFFYPYMLRRHPKNSNTNTAPSMRLLFGGRWVPGW